MNIGCVGTSDRDLDRNGSCPSREKKEGKSIREVRSWKILTGGGRREGKEGGGNSGPFLSLYERDPNHLYL